MLPKDHAEQSSDPDDVLAETRRLMELRHYSPRTVRTYLGWIRRFLQFNNSTEIGESSPENVKTYLSYLASRRNVAASTQNKAFNALLFFYRNVLHVDLGDLGDTVRAVRERKLPVVLSPEETRSVLCGAVGTARLMLELVYGAGLRVSELVTLRVKDIDFDAGTLTVRSGKDDRDRTSFLPVRPVDDLRQHLLTVQQQHQQDLDSGAGNAPLPSALSRKYPNAGREWSWQFSFPSDRLNRGEDGRIYRWHVLQTMAPDLRSPLDDL